MRLLLLQFSYCDGTFRAEIARHAPQYRITIATSVSSQQQTHIDDGNRAQQAVVQQRSGPIIIETNSAHALWGGFETPQAYAKAVFAGPIGHSWKVEVVEDGVRLFNSYAEILDRGLRLEVTTSGTEEITMQTIADLARLKKWDTITVSGNETHLLRVVRAAQQQHLHVESKTHSAEQIHMLQQQEQAQRRKGWSR